MSALARDDEPIAVASNASPHVLWLKVRPAKGGDWRRIRPVADAESATVLAEQRARSTSDWEFCVE